MDETALQNELISFMFLRDSTGALDVMACLRLWFGKSNETDIEIETRFGKYVAQALNGGLQHWQKTARGCLALMILIDQFPRNIYRHTLRMFAGDRTSRDMVYNSGHDWLEELAPEECIFVPCLVLTHQENVDEQMDSVKFYDKLEPRLPKSLHIFRTILEEHCRIISLCNTFPHRDHYYGRTTSAIGKSLMDNPTVRFDLPLCADETGRVFFGHDPAKLLNATTRVFDVVDRIDAMINRSSRRTSDTPTTSSAPFITRQQSAEFAEIFRTFDKDGSGFLEIHELTAVLQAAGHQNYTDRQLHEAVDAITGRKGSTGLTFEQFASLLQKNVSVSLAARLEQRFKLFDADGSGNVEFEEFTACIQALDELVTTSEAAAMFKKCDSDGNGSISLQEFMVVMEKKLVAVKLTPGEATAPKVIAPPIEGPTVSSTA